MNRLLNFLKWPITRIIIELILFFGGLYLVKEFAIKPALAEFGLAESLRINIQGMLTIALMFIAYKFIMRFLEKRPVQELAVKALPGEAAYGLVIGMGAITLIICVLWIAGAYTVTGVNFEFAYSYVVIWVFLLATLEELLFRGILYRSIEEYGGTLAALAVSAILFGGMHIFNDNADLVSVVSATSGGLLMGILFTWSGRLWIPIFMHTAWNFSQIFYGTTMSGMDDFGVILESELEGPDWLVGGNFGPENSYVAIGVVVGLFLLFYGKARARGAIVPWRGKRED